MAKLSRPRRNKAAVIYADEADVLNVALFGMTVENINAVLINDGIP